MGMKEGKQGFFFSALYKLPVSQDKSCALQI